MEGAQEVQLHVLGDRENKGNETSGPSRSELNNIDNHDSSHHPTCTRRRRSYALWFRTAIYALLLLAGQTAAMLLTRLYFTKGGQSKWMGTLAQMAGFPILIPFYFFFTRAAKNTANNRTTPQPKPSKLALASVYITLGLAVAAICYMGSIGLLYLPVTTLTLIGTSQLAFTAVFSFLLNGQKLTFLILNSVLLLILSSVVLVLNSDGSSGAPGVPHGKYVLGFLCTLGSAAGLGLMLASTQLFFRKVIKDGRVAVVIEVVFYQYLVATCVSMIGLFVSGEWQTLHREMNEFELGKVSYVMTIFWSTVCFEMSTVGSMGLIFEVAALFANVIAALSLPLIQIAAVITFHDKMNGVKAVSLVLALWGFVSYTYQHYIDEYHKPKIVQGTEINNEAVSRFPRVEELDG